VYGTHSFGFCLVSNRNSLNVYFFHQCAIKIRKEIQMDKSDLLSTLDSETKSSKSKANKRKWREIEAIHDRHQLRQELRELGMSAEDELEFL
jgi:hypothetical protein